MNYGRRNILPLIGGILTAFAASLCCIGPLVLVMLGMGGAWVSSLSVMEPFRPYLLGIAIIFLFLAWKKIYRTEAEACTPGSLCAKPNTNTVYKIMFWIMAVLIVIALGSPYIAPFFY